MKRLYAVVEGFCEEAFVRQRLRPHLSDRGIWTEVIIVTTSRDAGGSKHRGGGQWAHWKRDIEKVYKEQASSDAWVTTMFDLYGLPKDFPDLDEIRRSKEPSRKTEIAERAIERAAQRFGDGRWFVPYVQQHEFEALVLACLGDLGRMLDSKADLAGLAALSADIGDTSPEDVNDGEQTAPSKRLIHHIPGYDKRLYGEFALCEVPMSALAERCPHFGGWLARLEALA